MFFFLRFPFSSRFYIWKEKKKRLIWPKTEDFKKRSRNLFDFSKNQFLVWGCFSSNLSTVFAIDKQISISCNQPTNIRNRLCSIDREVDTGSCLFLSPIGNSYPCHFLWIILCYTRIATLWFFIQNWWFWNSSSCLITKKIVDTIIRHCFLKLHLNQKMARLVQQCV